MKPSRHELIVADAGPLIALAIIGQLELLQRLFLRVIVPPAVFAELHTQAIRPGATGLAAAHEAGWLCIGDECEPPAALLDLLDRGEASAIVLAEACRAPLLMDERQGRKVAAARGITVLGTGAVLVAAKRRRLIPAVAPVLEQLRGSGYRLSPALCERLRELAHEA